MAVVHLIRHGKVANPEGVLYGRLPGYNLSEVGTKQAQAARDHLRDRDVGLVWTSPLERAQETAQIVAEPHGVDVVVDERIIESGTDFEGRPADVFRILSSPLNWWRLRNPFRPSWGESFAEIRARMLAATEDAVDAAGGREAVLVSHQTPIIVARAALARYRRPPWLTLLPPHTGSVTTVELEGRDVVSASYFTPSSAPPGGTR